MRKIEVKSNEELISRVTVIIRTLKSPEEIMINNRVIYLMPSSLRYSATEAYMFANAQARTIAADNKFFDPVSPERKDEVDALADRIIKIPSQGAEQIPFKGGNYLIPGIDFSLSLRQRTKEAYKIANELYDKHEQPATEPVKDKCSGCKVYLEDELGINLATLSKKTDDFIQDEIEFVKTSDTTCMTGRMRKVQETFTEGEMVSLAYSFINAAAREHIDMTSETNNLKPLTTEDVINILSGKGL